MFKENNEIFTSIIIGSILALFLIFFVLIVIIRYKIRQQRHLQETGLMQSQFQHALLQTQIEIQEQTLNNISQEIHDNIGQVLSLAKLNLNTFAVIPDAATQTKLNDTKQLISKALQDLRDLSRSMHGDKIAELGLQGSISDELKILQNTGLFNTNLLITGNEYKLEPQKEMVLFRLVQEALNNAVKHSGAKTIEVHLLYDTNTFRLSVTDNGIGFNQATLLAAETGIGLKNMKNRAALIGADFILNSDAETGTNIIIELKMNATLQPSTSNPTP